MSNFTITLTDYPGNKYTVQVPNTATVQDLMDAVKPHVRAKYNSTIMKVTKIRYSNRDLDPSEKVSSLGASFDPSHKFYVFVEDKSAPLRSYFANENRRKRGAIQRVRSNQTKLIQNVEASLPTNVIDYKIKPFLGGKSRRLRKGRKARQTRRRR
jgi:uncharacterized ubiquitin-like protein YukD